MNIKVSLLKLRFLYYIKWKWYSSVLGDSMECMRRKEKVTDIIYMEKVNLNFSDISKFNLALFHTQKEEKKNGIRKEKLFSLRTYEKYFWIIAQLGQNE